ncbi:CLUMA_CG004900, isoform A [Clunio marinus]|uniref:CLUMA_CG004900, isoform A n=1 Tax=Clunio marinus TaxID=568069 RepID=A0A1J1HUJ4_9DIPT|nr:CLUMA_CG004900, isoform A [Clunio marinus]
MKETTSHGISETDRLSLNICHACISYLNSWQSFKNRCDAAQRKQKIWLSTGDGKASSGQSLLKTQLNGHGNHLKPALENAQQKFQEKQAELQREKLQQLVQQQQEKHQVDTSFIKSEPASDDDDDEENVMELDPSQFLAQGSSDEEEESVNEDSRAGSLLNGNGPPILTSLGLTHVNSIPSNPFASYLNSDDSASEDKASEVSSNGSRQTQVPASCSVCNLQFSNRANARRHEKNIHMLSPKPIGPSATASSNQQSKVKAEAQHSTMSQPLSSNISLTKRARVQTPIHIDYTKPERYRHLLTPSKLHFILSNLNFLEQAQNMKCKCCNKQFPSYKFFMGHMRKKYHGLPRNVCFKCLKQFDSKGQFIGHLKRPGGTCPNLYRLVMADDQIPKNLLPTDTNLRTPAKDVLANRVYACAICDDTFRLKSDFREHVYRTHLEVTKNRETPNASCINCNESFTDSSVRRRHFNNLDCIVYIVCNTCGEQFPSQAVYLEHVYQTHLQAQENGDGGEEILFEEPPEMDLSGSGGDIVISNKSTQSCPVCDKQYNNYYNVLRHMEAKHPDQVPQVYQCPECPDEKFSKQTYLREHLAKVHNKVDVSSRQLMQHQITPAFVCKIPNCGKEFRKIPEWLEHQVSQHNDQQLRCMFCDHIGDSREEFEKHVESHMNQTQGESDDENPTPTKTDPEQTKSYKCRHCNKRIATKTGLQKHMIKVHNVGGELVKCTLCPADFANDKGLKVHLWRCHEIREADYEKILPPDLLDPYMQQQRKIKQEEEQKSILIANQIGSTKVFECLLCHIVYTSRDELAEHQKTIHAMDDVDVMETDDTYNAIMQENSSATPIAHVTGDDDSQMNAAADAQEYWFQCRFCQRSFNSSKKLTIHMNSHQDGASNGPDKHGEYPCKECNMVYKSKKSLWVHRHKKHPRIPEPSHCIACEKTFFDKAEFVLHKQQVHPGSVDNHLEGEADDGESFLTDGHWLLDSSTSDSPTQMKPPGRDINMITTNSGTKKRNRPAPSETPDGEFACDMCPKAFSNANALQVHRGWHFRSPDGRKVTDPSQMWMPNQTPPSKVRRNVAPVQLPSVATPICQHCNTKFASHNNLRRHIIEVHKKSQSGSTLHDGTTNDDVKVDRVGECTKCNVTFSTLAEWVDHKINDAKNKRSSFVPSSGGSSGGGYEWNCEICTKIFTRKERLMQHMLSHLNDREMNPDVLAIHKQQLQQQEGIEKEEDDESKKKTSKNGVRDSEDEADSSGEDETENSDDEDEEEDDDNSKPKTFSCELCHFNFENSQELRSHVAEHFLNGGGTQTTVKKEEKVEESDTELDIDEYVEQELNEVELEEAQVDYQQATTSLDEDESSSDDDDSSSSADKIEETPKNSPHPPLPKIQVQVHRCRVCNAAFLDTARSVECMMNHQKPTSYKCSECQLFFNGSKQLQDHEKLCHS